MNEEVAKNLIHQTFESEFNKTNFLNFTMNLFKLTTKEVEETRKGPWQGNYIPDPYKDYVSKYERIARYITEDSKKRHPGQCKI